MNTNARKRGAKVAPSFYPRFVFHGLRSAQLVSSIVVSGIMSYFMYYLRVDHYAIPWTFITLLAISLATVASLLLTIIMYNITYLSPKFNILLNGTLSVVWILGLGLLSSNVGKSLSKHCDKKTWGGYDSAVGICRDYKALWAFTLIGTVSTLAALVLDVWTHQVSIRQGVYAIPEDNMNARILGDTKSPAVGGEGFEMPERHRGESATLEEEDIAYHSRYGLLEEQGHEPVGQDVGKYHDL